MNEDTLRYEIAVKKKIMTKRKFFSSSFVLSIALKMSLQSEAECLYFSIFYRFMTPAIDEDEDDDDDDDDQVEEERNNKKALTAHTRICFHKNNTQKKKLKWKRKKERKAF